MGARSQKFLQPIENFFEFFQRASSNLLKFLTSHLLTIPYWREKITNFCKICGNSSTNYNFVTMKFFCHFQGMATSQLILSKVGLIVFSSVCKYNDYLRNQRGRVQEHHNSISEEKMEQFACKKLKRVTVPCNQQLMGLKTALEKTNDLEPVNVADHVSGDINRYTMYLLMKSVKETGFPSIAGYDVYHYFLSVVDKIFSCLRARYFLPESIKADF